MVSLFNSLCLQLEVGIQTTALHIACLNGHSQIAKLLIESGAMINAQTEVNFNNCSYHIKFLI